jgi:hypothetical protein
MLTSSGRPGSSLSSAAKRAHLNITITDFKAGMEKFAAMFTKAYNLRLLFRGTKAETNGRTITVPEISVFSRPNMTDAEVEEALKAIMCVRGFVFHEGAHIMKTDFVAWNSAARRGPKFRLLVNILEDVRIETWISGVFQGAKEALHDTRAWVYEEVIRHLQAGDVASQYAQLIYAVSLVGHYPDRYASHPLWNHLSAPPPATPGSTPRASRRPLTRPTRPPW